MLAILFDYRKTLFRDRIQHKTLIPQPWMQIILNPSPYNERPRRKFEVTFMPNPSV